MTNIMSLEITPADIEAAAAAGACEQALVWAREAPRTWREARPSWRGWFAAFAAERRGDVARADELYEAANDPEYWRGEGALAAEYRGDTVRADALYAQSDDPAFWRGKGAVVAERRGDTTRAAALRALAAAAAAARAAAEADDALKGHQ